jgi:hypothetical protein
MGESTNHPTIKAMSQPPKPTAALECFSQAANPSAEIDRRLTKGSPRSILLEQAELPPHPEAVSGQGPRPSDLAKTVGMAPPPTPIPGGPVGPEFPDMAVSRNIG